MSHNSGALLEQSGNFNVLGEMDSRLPTRGQGERPVVAAAGNGQAAAPAMEEGPTPADGTRPEVEGMLQTILNDGGEQIVERLKAMDAEAAAAECTQPEIGRLIENYYVPLLMSALELDDEEFNAEYPGERQATAAQRAELAEVLEEHWRGCPRCLPKASGDWEWDKHVNEVADKKSIENKFSVLRV